MESERPSEMEVEESWEGWERERWGMRMNRREVDSSWTDKTGPRVAYNILVCSCLRRFWGWEIPNVGLLDRSPTIRMHHSYCCKTRVTNFEICGGPWESTQSEEINLDKPFTSQIYLNFWKLMESPVSIEVHISLWINVRRICSNLKRRWKWLWGMK